MPIISEWAIPFVRVGGVFAAMKGPGAEQELLDTARSEPMPTLKERP